MPDDHHPLCRDSNPEDIDLGAIKADLEFLIEQVTRSRKEQALNRHSSGTPQHRTYTSTHGKSLTIGNRSFIPQITFGCLKQFLISIPGIHFSPNSFLIKNALNP